MSERDKLIEKMVQRVLKEWRVYDRCNVELSSEAEAKLLSDILLQVVLDATEAGEMVTICQNCKGYGKDFEHNLDGEVVRVIACKSCNGAGVVLKPDFQEER